MVFPVYVQKNEKWSKIQFVCLEFLKRSFFLIYLLNIYCFWIVKKCWNPYVSNTFSFPIIPYQTTTGNYNLGDWFSSIFRLYHTKQQLGTTTSQPDVFSLYAVRIFGNIFGSNSAFASVFPFQFFTQYFLSNLLIHITTSLIALNLVFYTIARCILLFELKKPQRATIRGTLGQKKRTSHYARFLL